MNEIPMCQAGGCNPADHDKRCPRAMDSSVHCNCGAEPAENPGVAALRSAAVAALGMCERITTQYKGIKYGVDFQALLAALERALDLHSSLTRAAAGAAAAPSQAAQDVLAERRRQIKAEGWTPEHDDEHDGGELADVAACYALGVYSKRADAGVPGDIPPYWPTSWDESWWRPKDRRRNLVRAAALLIAEIERQDRAAQQGAKA